MAADSEVLRQFLVSLGFHVDEPSLNKFGKSLAGSTNIALTLAKATVGVAIAAEAMVVRFASSMEKLYYASRRTGASVENIQALEYGFKQIGLSAGDAHAAIESMAATLRTNPGMRGYLDSIIGKDSSSMDQAEAMITLMQKLSSLPHYQGAAIAGQFGMDERTFMMVKQGMPELIAAEERRKELNAKMGIDAQKTADASKEYMNSLRDIGTKIEAIGLKWMTEVLPYFREMNRLINQALDRLATFKLDEGIRSLIEAWGNLKKGVEVHKLTPAEIAERDRKDAEQRAQGAGRISGGKIGDGLHGNGTTTPSRMASGKISYPGAPSTPTDPNSLFGQLEKRYGLPAGLLDTVWNVESGRGKNLRSKKGAKGHFQFMDPTAKEYGLQNPDDLNESANAAARYYADLLKKYSGDLSKAAAAYNWGQGRVDTLGMGRAPFDTRDYVAKINKGVNGQAGGGVTVQQNTEINVHGAGDPKAVASEVMRGQTLVNSNLARNLGGGVVQ